MAHTTSETIVVSEPLCPVPGTPEWSNLNLQRVALTRKKNREGLTPEENAEFEQFQSLFRKALEIHYPAAVDDDHLEQIEARVMKTAETEPE